LEKLDKAEEVLGSDFASNLITDGFQVKVYDRNEKHSAPLVARGATAAASLGDLASCEAVLTSLPDDDALADVTLRDEGLVHCGAGQNTRAGQWAFDNLVNHMNLSLADAPAIHNAG
jgi:3-hydroxyisobutyrate dehydrogenase-like beta-hydroxyacid dehydrogenase